MINKTKIYSVKVEFNVTLDENSVESSQLLIDLGFDQIRGVGYRMSNYISRVRSLIMIIEFDELPTLEKVTSLQNEIENLLNIT